METTRVVPRGSKTTSVLGKIYSECKIFSSIIFILDKLESDGYFERINECLQFIFNKEMAFAVFELKKIKSRKKKFDIKNQLVNNTFIFKENLKIITGSLIDTLWNEKVRTERIQHTIQKAQQEINKGTFEEIIELGEEEENYFSSDAPLPKETGKKLSAPVEEDFPHSYETDLASKDFRFGSRGAESKKGAGEDKSREAEEVTESPKAKLGAQVGKIKLVKKDARDFGTFGEVEQKIENENWDQQFEIEVGDKESIEKQISRMESKEITACQSMGSKWDLRGWEAQSNGEKPRTSASMGSLTLKSTQKITSSEKHQSGTVQKEQTSNGKANWKRSSGLNMYLLSRKNGSSQGSSMRSVSKSGSLRQENSSGAKSESLKRKREHKNWLREDVRKRPIPKKTLADRLSGKKQRKVRNGPQQAKTYRAELGNSMTPDLNLKKRGNRVSSLTKLKRLKNHLLRNPQNGSEHSLNQEKGTRRGRKVKSRSPHQILGNLAIDFEKSPETGKGKRFGVR